jgi:ADP-ribose pyrophosphatase YjhB (NUDIX family)
VTSYFATDPTAIRLSVSTVVWRGVGAARELLLMQRSDNGHWGLPGGYVDAGEDVRHAAARELLEETGVEGRIGRLIGVYSDPARQVIAYPDGARVQAVNLCFEAQVLTQGEPTTPEEVLSLGYFAPGALPEPFVPIHAIRVEDALSGDPATQVR